MKISDNSSQSLRILNIAFYRFQSISDLEGVRRYFLDLAGRLGLKGTVLVSFEGLNSSLAGQEGAVREFQAVLAADARWAGLEYKESFSTTVPFQNLFVKLKKEIIPVGDPTVVPEKYTGPRILPSELKKWLDEKRDFTLLDTRNDYETIHGTFDGAVTLDLQHFRDFRNKVASLAPELRARPMVMVCTGGIRCEKASVLAQKEGFEEVYQLDGGILKYFEQYGGAHYQGSCFIFDERVALDPSLQPISDPIVKTQSATQKAGS